MEIDVVYTWVDNNDPNWQHMYAEASAERKKSDREHKSVDNPARFANRNEIYYSIKSVKKYAPWVRNIYIVSNCSQPEWSKSVENIIYVKHEQIFPDNSCLPTFSSRAIETVLHKIEGLSENFLYFNDDVFLCKSVSPDDFFWGDGRIYFFPSKHDIPYTKPFKAIRPVDVMAINSANLLVRDFCYKPIKKLHHTPHPLSRSLLNEIENRYRPVIERTRSHAFKHDDDVALATTLHAYYAECVGRGKRKEIASRYVDIGDPLFILLVHPWSPLMRGKYVTLCLNEITSVKFLSGLRDRIVRRVMTRLFD